MARLVEADNFAKAQNKKDYSDWRKEVLEKILKSRGQLNRLEEVRSKAEAGSIGQPVEAYVNHGRLVADCPDCNGAEIVNYGGSFFCLSCLNDKNKNRPRPVKKPRNMRAIIEQLEKRTIKETMNWNLGESLDDINQGNKERGL